MSQTQPVLYRTSRGKNIVDVGQYRSFIRNHFFGAIKSTLERKLASDQHKNDVVHVKKTVRNVVREVEESFHLDVSRFDQVLKHELINVIHEVLAKVKANATKDNVQEALESSRSRKRKLKTVVATSHSELDEFFAATRTLLAAKLKDIPRHEVGKIKDAIRDTLLRTQKTYGVDINKLGEDEYGNLVHRLLGIATGTGLQTDVSTRVVKDDVISVLDSLKHDKAQTQTRRNGVDVIASAPTRGAVIVSQAIAKKPSKSSGEIGTIGWIDDKQELHRALDSLQVGSSYSVFQRMHSFAEGDQREIEFTGKLTRVEPKLFTPDPSRGEEDIPPGFVVHLHFDDGTHLSSGFGDIELTSV